MCFGKYKKKQRRVPRNKVLPLNPNRSSKKTPQERYIVHETIKEKNTIVNKQREEFHSKFIKEIIPCGFCNKKFDLGSNELKINCGSCDKFFHCHIGGKCSGENCSIEMPNGTIERISYCLNCCDSYTCQNGNCICNKCNNSK